MVTGALPLGSSVYDTVSFTGGVAGFTPDLSQVSYTFTSPSGTAGAGSGAQSTTEGPLGAGSYKFDASFAGDANYNLAVSGDEPLSINKATITAQHDDLQRRQQFGGQWSVASGLVGVRYGQLHRRRRGLHARPQPGELHIHEPERDRLVRVAVPNRQRKGRWERAATSLTLRSPATRTTIWRSAATNHSRSIERRSPSTRRSTTPPTIRWSVERCLWARRCTIRSASPAASRASRPTLSQVSYTFTSPSGTAGAGSGGQSTTEGPLGAGSYKFDASFAGDANYNLAVSGDEPLTINKATITSTRRSTTPPTIRWSPERCLWARRCTIRSASPAASRASRPTSAR